VPPQVHIEKMPTKETHLHKKRTLKKTYTTDPKPKTLNIKETFKIIIQKQIINMETSMLETNVHGKRPAKTEL